MSYVDGNSNTGRKMLASGSVALIEVGLVLALIKGFTVAFSPPAPPPHLPTSQYPTAPRPDPVEVPDPPRDPPRDPVSGSRSVDTVTRTLAPANDPVTIADPLPDAGPVDIGDAPFVPEVKPSDPPARFQPRVARPRNDVAGWVMHSDYPTADIRAEHTGTVRFRVAIDGNGRVTGCTVVESSGFPGLDEATCRNVTRRARFEPASDGNGDRIAGSYSGTIRWVIPRD